jgi:hypothetical protein
VLIAQHPDTPTIDPAPVRQVTWQDQAQAPPAPPQRVEFELLPDDPPLPLQRVADLHPFETTMISPIIGTPQHLTLLPPPPWTDYDVAAACGTAITVPTTSAAFANPATSDCATLLATRINELHEELRRAQIYHNTN